MLSSYVPHVSLEEVSQLATILAVFAATYIGTKQINLANKQTTLAGIQTMLNDINTQASRKQSQSLFNLSSAMGLIAQGDKEGAKELIKASNEIASQITELDKKRDDVLKQFVKIING